MACEICGRNSCTRSFHSIEEQDNFDEIANQIKDRMKSSLKYRIERLDDYGDETRILVDLDEVLSIIDSYS